MNYVITGGAGHISKPLAESLLQAGHQVTVIGRNEANLKELIAKGAKVAIGSVEDLSFLKKAFSGADAIYTMIPPNFGVADWKAYIGQIGKNYADAIQANGIKHVVNLSSVGAHMAEGCGPVSGLFYAEKALNALTETNVLHLRPGYFYYNFFGNIAMIKHMNIIGSNFNGNSKLIISDTSDIAEVAASELLNLNFTGHSYKYIASDEKNPEEIAKTLGSSIGKPDLNWVAFSDEDAFNGMTQAGLPAEIAKNFVEMGTAIRSGEMFSDYWKNHPAELSKVKLQDFAKTFATAYNAS